MNDLSIRIAASYKTMVTRVKVWQEGATAAEYALLVALIAVAIIGGATLLGDTIREAFNSTAAEISDGVVAGTN